MHLGNWKKEDLRISVPGGTFDRKKGGHRKKGRLFPARGCRTRLDVEEAVVLKGVGLFWVRWEDCKLLL